MKFNQLFNNVDFEVKQAPAELVELDIKDLAYDSRKVKPGYLFVAIAGIDQDGHKYVKAAYDQGARVFLVSEDIDLPADAIVLKTDNTRKALSALSANYFGHPSRELEVIGVTGTKGKTTISNYIKTVLCASGVNTGVIGTIGAFYNDQEIPTINTTPESYELNRIMREMLDNGVKAVAMEVSSGALMLHRVDDIDIDLGIFTNLSPDHVGPREHPTFEDYRDCKAKLFKICKHGVFNIDDENAAYMMDHATCDVKTFSIKKPSDFQAENIQLTREGSHLGVDFDFIHEGAKTLMHISTPGEFSILNALAVIGVADYLDLEQAKVIEALKTAQVNGRVEVLPVLDDVTVIVDYAHNGMSLENVLSTLLQYKPNRLICVFGSVGGRTELRRKELGDVAARLCDVAILTSDNPDFEDPQNVIDDIAKSFVDSDCEVLEIVDRSEAMYQALKMAQPGDMVVIAGKGHETYQIIKGEHVHFDEKGEVRKAAARVKA